MRRSLAENCRNDGAEGGANQGNGHHADDNHSLSKDKDAISIKKLCEPHHHQTNAAKDATNKSEGWQQRVHQWNHNFNKNQLSKPKRTRTKLDQYVERRHALVLGEDVQIYLPVLEYRQKRAGPAVIF